MEIKTDNEQILKPPRYMQIIVAKYFGVPFLGIGLMGFITSIYINSNPDPLSSNLVVLSTTIGRGIFFLPERYRTYLSYNKTNNLLKISARGKKIKK
jgi:hypothetical protein